MFGRTAKRNDTAAAPTNSPALLASARHVSNKVFDSFVIPMKMTHNLSSLVVVSMLGSLAGHACQVAALDGLARRRPEYAGLSLAIAQTETDSYYLGDAVNRPVAEWQYSVFALVAGIAEHIGATIPDLGEIAGYVASTIGHDSFGHPRDLPADGPSVRTSLRLWSLAEAVAAEVPEADYVPVTFALAYQRLAQTDNAVDRSVDQAALARVMLESTMAMSKLQVLPNELDWEPADPRPNS